MSVSSVSESLSYCRDLNEKRSEIIEGFRRYENEAMRRLNNSTPNAKIQRLVDGIEKTIHECRVTDELDNYLKFVSELKELIGNK